MLHLLLSCVILLPAVPFSGPGGHCAENIVTPTCAAPATPCQRANLCCQTPGPCCQNAPPADCPVCGTNACTWDCSADPGTDVDSLTLDAQAGRLLTAAQAELRFQVPEDSVLWLGNRRVSALGEQRTVRVPIPDVTKSYRYEARVEFVLNGKKYFRKIVIGGLQAGKIVSCTFTIPQLKQDDIPTIDFARQEVAQAKP